MDWLDYIARSNFGQRDQSAACEYFVINKKNGEGSHVTYIIGNNGTGKSRILAELAQHYGLADQGHVDSVLCISNAVTDRFKFGSSVDVKVKYLGSRTVGNAVHLTLLARSIAKNLCEGIVSSKFELFDKIKAALGTEFYLALPGLRKKSLNPAQWY